MQLCAMTMVFDQDGFIIVNDAVLENSAVDQDGFIIVNDAALENSAGAAYRLPAQARALLLAYQDGYGGVIPAGAYLLLGDNANSVIDSTRLGLIHISDFIMTGPGR